jgi:hypothetical protein
MKRFAIGLIVLLVAAAVLGPGVARAITTNTFYGITTHVSVNSIKVMDPKNHQELSFEILPKFDQIFSADGKTTYQMKDIKAGQYVGIIYDQKTLGVRHADKIYLMNNANQKIGVQ